MLMGRMMRTVRMAVLVLFACGTMPCGAQNKKIGDYIESYTYNTTGSTPRRLQYHPEGRAFVCENGTNRFTRALYGGYTDYRIETSDRPVFAVAKKGHHRNIRFYITANGITLQTDSAEWCRCLYEDGIRSYTLKDKRWNGGEIRIDVVATVDSEAGIWQFYAKGFDTAPILTAKVCNIFKPKLSRNGDIGADPKGVFEPSPTEENLSTSSFALKTNGNTYFGIDLDSISADTQESLKARFDATVAHNRTLASRITFNTPDKYINTLGGALVMAADGDWDGQTWLHGCVGWRMPLAGWRAGYIGDVLGWNDRAIKHFDAYAKSQVTDVEPTIPHPTQDKKLNMARAEKRWGTQMYSNGYICRNPERNNQMHHYDMNLNYIDELLWHFQYDADTTYLRKMWNTLTLHLAWEKRNYDPDDDGLYDAYCCIWASDALYYNGGAVTHSSAYNYRANLLASRIAEIIGEDGTKYKKEAEKTLNAMNSRLWMADKGHWAEYEDGMGLKRRHESAAVWSIYTPIDCGAGSSEQFYKATDYVNHNIPHIDVTADGNHYGQTISTSNWLPYSWSINNVAAAEVMHTALAFYEAGRNEEAFAMMKANIMDQMYIGQSPANFGQISHYDAARGECYRDFGDCIGISARTLIQGLFGIKPQALYGKCVIQPGFPASWDSASVSTPYLSYIYNKVGDKIVLKIKQNFAQRLKIVVRQHIGNGKFIETEGNSDEEQTIVIDNAQPATSTAMYEIQPANSADALAASLGLSEPDCSLGKYRTHDISRHFNASVSDIFNNEYLSPRPQTTTLQIPVQGIGEWCHPQFTVEINDSVLRSTVRHDMINVAGVPFRTPAKGSNIIYTSLWDNYPDSVTVALKNARASRICLLMAGSTNHMQCHIDNAIVTALYTDGTVDTLVLRNPDNWCPIEQDYYIDSKAFRAISPRPYRVCLGTATVSRDLGTALNIQGVYGREIPGGAAQMLIMPVDKRKKLQSLTLRTLSNDIVVGLMAVTLQ